MNSTTLLPLINNTPVSLIGTTEKIAKLELEKIAYLNSCDYVEFNMDLFSERKHFYIAADELGNVFLAKEITDIFVENKFIVIKNLEKSKQKVVNSLIFLLERLQKLDINNPFVIVIDTKHNLDHLSPILNRTACLDCL
jgi:hypothetical protein